MAFTIDWVWNWYSCVCNIEYYFIQRTTYSKDINLFIISGNNIRNTNFMEIIKKIWGWIRSRFVKDEIITIIVSKDGVDELWVYKNGKRISNETTNKG